jgi:hypothetical protein
MDSSFFILHFEQRPTPGSGSMPLAGLPLKEQKKEIGLQGKLGSAKFKQDINSFNSFFS